jgi:rhodanese-related sulfurtransferase
MNFLKQLFGLSANTNLSELINNAAFLVDVRTISEFEGGSVKGAVNIPLDTVSNQLAKFKNKQHIIVFCQSGMRSSQAAAILKQSGFTNVSNGGSWKSVSAYVK